MISLDGVNKVFRLPHDKRTTLRQRFVGLLQKQSYEKLYALREITLRVKKGEFLGIIGKNGSGKSTLLKLIAKVLERRRLPGRFNRQRQYFSLWCSAGIVQAGNRTKIQLDN